MTWLTAHLSATVVADLQTFEMVMLNKFCRIEGFLKNVDPWFFILAV